MKDWNGGDGSTGTPPERIGPYRLLRKVGEGGMGEVYEAEQSEPVRRQVALKIIKHGMDTQRVVARFEVERQALAMMDHSAVAKVFDAGTTPRGRPFFVMEFVNGVPITEHCDRNRLTMRERLELFVQVCHGVQHAHQKAIIHRDLKPSNVLVATQDGKAVPKIIDFGVAKATTEVLTERTLFTELGTLIGTPEYMSPEQADMGTRDVDTRTDVYSLGVMLYELLAGALPFDPKELRSAGYQSIVETIRDQEPPRPSTRVSSLGEQSAETARCRRVDPPALERQLAGDLDWITMKSMEKLRARRYGSPAELAAEIERYLADEPVLARPPSKAYRTGKFIRRHKLGVAATAVVLLVVAAGIVGSTVGLVRARRAEARAQRQVEAKTQVANFLKDLFKVSNPSEARGNSITARELLDRGSENIRTALAEEPETRAELTHMMGGVYRSLGLYSQAEELTEEALATFREVLGDGDPVTANSMNSLAVLYDDQSRYPEAEALYLESLEIRRRELGDDHPSTLDTMNNLGLVYWNQGHYDKAEPLYLETLERRRRILGEHHSNTLSTMSNLALLYWNQENKEEAERLFVEALAHRRDRLGNDHPDTINTLNSLGSLLQSEERYDEAGPLLAEALELQKRVFGVEHPNTAMTLHNLACLRRDTGEYEASRELFELVVQVDEKLLGAGHVYVAEDLAEYAKLLRLMGEDEQAAALEARAETIRAAS